jgi:hypothetical protein
MKLRWIQSLLLKVGKMCYAANNLEKARSRQ